MARYCFDLDGTLVTDVQGKYELCKPIPKAVEKVRRLWEAGHKIFIQTARGVASKKERYRLTAKQLADFRIPYDELIVGYKPSADYFIDDKAINVQDWLDDEEEALQKVKTVDHEDRFIGVGLPIRFDGE